VQITKVELPQFLWDSDNSLTHIPTGATFSWKYPHSDLSDVIINWKLLTCCPRESGLTLARSKRWLVGL